MIPARNTDCVLRIDLPIAKMGGQESMTYSQGIHLLNLSLTSNTLYSESRLPTILAMRICYYIRYRVYESIKVTFCVGDVWIYLMVHYRKKKINPVYAQDVADLMGVSLSKMSPLLPKHVTWSDRSIISDITSGPGTDVE